MRALFFCIGLMMWGTSGLALTPVTLALDWYINPDHAPILAAETQGYFAQNGLDVRLLEPTQTSEVRSLVASHQADFGIDYEPETLLALSQGLPIEMVGNLVPVPLACIATFPGTKITSIGYSGDSMEALFLQVELKHLGLDPKTVQLVPIHMDLTQALLSHSVSAVSGMMRNVEPVMLRLRGIPTQLYYPEQNGIPPYSELVLITHTGEDPEITAAFLKAVGEGAHYVKTHPQASWAAAVSAYPNELASSALITKENEQIWEASLPYFTEYPQRLDEKQIKAFQAFLDSMTSS